MQRSGDTQASLKLPAALLGLAFGVFASLIGAAVAAALLFGGGAGCGDGAVGSVKGVPAKLIPIYQQASLRYGLGERGPSVRAGVNGVETGFGATLGVSSAEAEGGRQFRPASGAI